MYEIKIKRQVYKDALSYSIPEICTDNFLNQLRNHLVEHRKHIAYVLAILDNQAIKSYCENLMNTTKEGYCGDLMNTTKKCRSYLIPESWNDNFLNQLHRYLFEHQKDISYILEILNNETIKGYGGNLMYTTMDGPIIFIYDVYDKDPETFGIRINRAALIEIFEAWLELHEEMEPRESIKEIIFQRDDEHITMIGHYEDGSESRRIFDYRLQTH